VASVQDATCLDLEVVEVEFVQRTEVSECHRALRVPHEPGVTFRRRAHATMLPSVANPSDPRHGDHAGAPSGANTRNAPGTASTVRGSPPTRSPSAQAATSPSSSRTLCTRYTVI